MNTNEYIEQLIITFEKDPWHGKSLLKQLEDINEEIAVFRPTSSNHNIIEILTHIILWREFVYEKLSGNDQFDLKFDTPEEWPPISTCSMVDVEKALERLLLSQQKLLRALESFGRNLETTVPGRNYSYSHMIKGILQHDVYHCGQIGLIKAIYKSTTSRVV